MEKRKMSWGRWLTVLLGTVVLMAMVIAPDSGFGGGQEEDAGTGAEQTAAHPLSLFDAAVLGIVEGATEYLPVSSTGHLLLAENILGLADDPVTKRAANAYAIVIQAGAILAVLGLYRRRIKQMLLGLTGRDADGRRLAMNLVLAFLPAVVAGLLLEDVIKKQLFGIWPVAAAWFCGGVFLIFLGKSKPQRISGLMIESFGWRQALGIGLMQCAALWPGVSRSLATIAGGLLMGAELGAAVEFSFLLGLITLGAATVYEALKNGHMIMANFGLIGPLLGFFCALVSAWISVKWMVSFLKRPGLVLFGWYRIVLALVVAAALLSGVGLRP